MSGGEAVLIGVVVVLGLASFVLMVWLEGRDHPPVRAGGLNAREGDRISAEPVVDASVGSEDDAPPASIIDQDRLVQALLDAEGTLPWRTVEAALHLAADRIDRGIDHVAFALNGVVIHVQIPTPRRHCGIALAQAVRAFLRYSRAAGAPLEVVPRRGSTQHMGLSAEVRFDGVIHRYAGRVVGMADQVYFEAESVDGITAAFHASVEDYLRMMGVESGEDLIPRAGGRGSDSLSRGRSSESA